MVAGGSINVTVLDYWRYGVLVEEHSFNGTMSFDALTRDKKALESLPDVMGIASVTNYKGLTVECNANPQFPYKVFRGSNLPVIYLRP
jgi:hypothetical protein